MSLEHAIKPRRGLFFDTSDDAAYLRQSMKVEPDPKKRDEIAAKLLKIQVGRRKRVPAQRPSGQSLGKGSTFVGNVSQALDNSRDNVDDD